MYLLKYYHQPTKKRHISSNESDNLVSRDQAATWRVEGNVVNLIVIALCEEPLPLCIRSLATPAPFKLVEYMFEQLTYSHRQ